MAPGCPPCPSKVDTGWEQAEASPWPSAKDHRRHCCTGPVAGAALQVPTLNQGCSCRRLEVGSVSHQVQAGGRPGPRGDLWPSGTQGRVGGGCGCAGAWPSRLSLQLLKASSTMALFTGGHGPSGRLHYRQAGAAGRQGFTASKDLAVSLCGRPHPPPEGEVLASPLTAFPPRGGGAPPTLSLGKQPGPAPPEGLPWESG